MDLVEAKYILFIALVALTACNRPEQIISGPLKQRGYIWQREWTPAVIDAVGETEHRMDGVVILGAELNLAKKQPDIVEASIDWEAVNHLTKHCSIALRVSPYAGPFASDDVAEQAVVQETKRLLNAAREHQVELEEFQLDFDCARKNLNGYTIWLQKLRPIVHPVRFVITTLPAWLDDPEFRGLVQETDGYVLQVHSVPISSSAGGRLCDPQRAQQWVTKAAKTGIPFSVALPTYRCVAGYDGANGKLLSVAMDSVQPSWPPGTRVLEFGAEPDEIAGLVRMWQESRSPLFQGLLWYRAPIATDLRNWRWITLEAVMGGRAPLHKLEIVKEGDNPVDFAIRNAGEADEQIIANVAVTWSYAQLTASDALAGWTVRREGDQAAVFSVNANPGVRLAPGATRKIGWLRFDQPTTVSFELK